MFRVISSIEVVDRRREEVNRVGGFLGVRFRVVCFFLFYFESYILELLVLFLFCRWGIEVLRD